MDESRAYSVKEAAERLSLSEVHVRRLIRRGDLRVRRVGRRVLIPAAALADFLAAS